MGIDFSHCDARWSYSGFMRFRTKLASSIGVTLGDMEGFSDQNPGREWSTIDDPIVPLLDHSDCDGELSPQDCARVAPRLREIIASWSRGDVRDDHDIRSGLLLADGMGAAANAGEALRFR